MKLKTVDINLSTPERVIHVLAKLLALFSLGFYILGIFSQHFNFPFGRVARGILLFVFFIAFSYFLSLYIKSDKAALFLIFFSSFTVLIIWNFLCDAQPVSDYEVLISGANSIIRRLPEILPVIFIFLPFHIPFYKRHTPVPDRFPNWKSTLFLHPNHRRNTLCAPAVLFSAALLLI